MLGLSPYVRALKLAYCQTCLGRANGPNPFDQPEIGRAMLFRVGRFQSLNRSSPDIRSYRIHAPPLQ